MKKITAYIILVFSLLALTIASSSYLMEAFSVWTPNPYRYGDLYLFSNIRKFKEEIVPCPVNNSPLIKSTNVNLYVLGDSYVEHLPASNYHTENYKYINWLHEKTYIEPLDTARKNILVIECVERYFRARMNDTTLLNNVITLSLKDGKIDNQQQKKFDLEAYVKWQAEDNLDYLLNYNDFSLFLKEIKAAINYYAFDKLDGRAIISDDEKYIFYRETTDSSKITSSFNPLTELEIDIMVQNINETYKYYKTFGFDEVYLSIIPNPVSINMPDFGKYNHMIERIHINKNLQVPIINIYEMMVKSDTNFYCVSDGHWNCEGKGIFINGVNDRIYEHSLSNKVK